METPLNAISKDHPSLPEYECALRLRSICAGLDPLRSDADFLVEFEAVPVALRMQNYFALREALASLLSRSVDLSRRRIAIRTFSGASLSSSESSMQREAKAYLWTLRMPPPAFAPSPTARSDVYSRMICCARRRAQSRIVVSSFPIATQFSCVP